LFCAVAAGSEDTVDTFSGEVHAPDPVLLEYQLSIRAFPVPYVSVRVATSAW